MSELVRTTSIDALYHSLSNSHSRDADRKWNAASLLQNWWRKLLKLRLLFQSLSNKMSAVEFLLQNLTELHQLSFDDVQKILTGQEMTQAISSILSCLPTDSSLKRKTAFVKTARFLNSSIMIYCFSKQILTITKESAGGQEIEEDTSEEAVLCRNAASMLFHAFIHLILAVFSSASIRNFRQALVSYRFSVRYYVVALEAWERIDSERLGVSLQAPFIEMYSLLIALDTAYEDGQMSKEDYDTAKLNATAQFDRIKETLIRVLGKRGEEIVSELKAYCEAFTSVSPKSSVDGNEMTSFKANGATSGDASAADVTLSQLEFTAEMDLIIAKSLNFDFTPSEKTLISNLVLATDVPLDTIIYELCVAGKYTVVVDSPSQFFSPYKYADEDDATASLKSASPRSAEEMKMFIRRRMLQILGDKLISSLRRSPYSSLHEIVVGAQVTLSLALRDATTGCFPSADTLTAKVGIVLYMYCKISSVFSSPSLLTVGAYLFISG